MSLFLCRYVNVHPIIQSFFLPMDGSVGGLVLSGMMWQFGAASSMQRIQKSVVLNGADGYEVSLQPGNLCRNTLQIL